jgi:hypothetical protein
VQQPVCPTRNELGHDDDRHGLRIGRDPAQVLEQRLADVAIRR